MTENEKRSGRPFQLRPFPSASVSEELAISGTLGRHHGTFLIKYRVEGKVDHICWPAPRSAISRCQQLWRQTCFELFFGIPGEPVYWEVNFAPYGSWNVYHFTGYRQGMREEAAAGRPICDAVMDGNLFSLSCRIDIHHLVPDSAGLEVAVAAVILDLEGVAGYWAIDHPGSRPDFHNRRGFLVDLPGMREHTG